LSPNELTDGAVITGQVFILQKAINYQGRTIENREEIVALVAFKMYRQHPSQDLYGVVMVTLDILLSDSTVNQVSVVQTCFALSPTL
jgi:hypothetical protein